MTPGILSVVRTGADGKPRTIRATMTRTGWSSSDRRFLSLLRRLYPIIPTEAGVPWIITFYTAVKALSATVLKKPVPDPWKGITMSANPIGGK